MGRAPSPAADALVGLRFFLRQQNKESDQGRSDRGSGAGKGVGPTAICLTNHWDKTLAIRGEIRSYWLQAISPFGTLFSQLQEALRSAVQFALGHIVCVH